MDHTPDLIIKAFRQAKKATERGDLDAAFKWTFVLDRQLDIIGRLIYIDENDRRLKRYRRTIVGLRTAMLQLAKAKESAQLAGGER